MKKAPSGGEDCHAALCRLNWQASQDSANPTTIPALEQY
jgi:hypothetical protein